MTEVAFHIEICRTGLARCQVLKETFVTFSTVIEKLGAEAEVDATKKVSCDKELAEPNQKKADKTAEIEKLTAKIEHRNWQL